MILAIAWDTVLDVLAWIGNLGLYLLWGVGMVFVMRLMKE